MALVKETLTTGLVLLFTNQYKGDLTPEQQQEIQDLSDGLADLIDTYIKTGTVTVAAGIGVQVTPATGTGATITTGAGTIT